jgi:hypothetical protein
MKIEKSFDLLNSEGIIIKIERILGNWHYNFNGSRHHVITSVKEILSVIWHGKAIINHSSDGGIYFLNDFPISMKGDDPKYYAGIVEYLLHEELEKCKSNPDYFKENYLIA